CQEINDDFEYKLWTDDNINEVFMYNKEYYDSWYQVKKAGAADILRIDILYQFGGIYVDVDTVCLKKFDQALLAEQFFAGYESLNNSLSNSPNSQLIANGVLGSIKSHPLLDLMRQNIKSKDLSETKSAWKTVGPALLTRSYHLFLKFTWNRDWSVKVRPFSDFYPYHHSEGKTIPQTTDELNSTLSKHNQMNSFTFALWGGTLLN
ncbi:hypothetical protein HK099_003269, partial [Clydaea vesicula]